MPGHDFRHAPPLGLSWATYLEHFVAEHGGWVALADALVHRGSGVIDLPVDLQTIEKGLRRLAAKEHKPAGQYGRWMLRFFGVPPASEGWARRLAQYHSRLSDLPTSLRLEQLRLWDRPPIAESSVAAWIQAGLASVFHRMNNLEACRQHLSRASHGAKRAGFLAVAEVSLLQARLATDDNDHTQAVMLFDHVEDLLSTNDISREDQLCYHARLAGQRGFHLTKPPSGEKPKLQEARKLFDARRGSCRPLRVLSTKLWPRLLHLEARRCRRGRKAGAPGG